MNNLKPSSPDSFLEADLQLQLKRIMEEEQSQENEENNRLKKLIQEGKIDTVCQILSHRKALATIKNL